VSAFRVYSRAHFACRYDNGRSLRAAGWRRVFFCICVPNGNSSAKRGNVAAWGTAGQRVFVRFGVESWPAHTIPLCGTMRCAARRGSCAKRPATLRGRSSMGRGLGVLACVKQVRRLCARKRACSALPALVHRSRGVLSVRKRASRHGGMAGRLTALWHAVSPLVMVRGGGTARSSRVPLAPSFFVCMLRRRKRDREAPAWCKRGARRSCFPRPW